MPLEFLLWAPPGQPWSLPGTIGPGLWGGQRFGETEAGAGRAPGQQGTGQQQQGSGWWRQAGIVDSRLWLESAPFSNSLHSASNRPDLPGRHHFLKVSRP